MNKKTVSALFVAGAIGASALAVGAHSINAQTVTTGTTNKNPMSNLVSAIAQKFGLNQADVQSVVDDTMKTEHTAMQAKMQAAFTVRLAQAVTDGKLTQAQADLITAKSAELKATMEANRATLQTLTREQIKAKMDTERTALQAWAKTNNIPEEYLHFVGGGKGFGGARGHWGLDEAKATAK